jgi:hypothetical protein
VGASLIAGGVGKLGFQAVSDARKLRLGATRDADFGIKAAHTAKKIGWGADELRTLTKSASDIKRFGPLKRGGIARHPNTIWWIRS